MCKFKKNIDKNIEENNSLEFNLSKKQSKKDFIKSFEGAKINFLLGSGFTADLYGTLNNYEIYLTKAKDYLNYELIEAYLLWSFFKNCIYKMVDTQPKDILNQISFIRNLQQLIARRGNPVENRQINIFTTNYDMVCEMALEEAGLYYNDGFRGRIRPYYSTSNYGLTMLKNMTLSEKNTILESFNIYKLHGSIALMEDNGAYIYNSNFKQLILSLYEEYNKKFDESIESKILSLLEKNKREELELISGNEDFCLNFVSKFRNMNIVLPMKSKFVKTVLDLNYHELLRIFSNELERKQSLLIVYGFSFSDEHITEIVKRSLENPTLRVYVVCFNKNEVEKIKNKIDKYKNYENIIFVYDEKNIDIKSFNTIIKEVYKNG